MPSNLFFYFCHHIDMIYRGTMQGKSTIKRQMTIPLEDITTTILNWSSELKSWLHCISLTELTECSSQNKHDYSKSFGLLGVTMMQNKPSAVIRGSDISRCLSWLHALILNFSHWLSWQCFVPQAAMPSLLDLLGTVGGTNSVQFTSALTAKIPTPRRGVRIRPCDQKYLQSFEYR